MLPLRQKHLMFFNWLSSSSGGRTRSLRTCVPEPIIDASRRRARHPRSTWALPSNTEQLNTWSMSTRVRGSPPREYRCRSWLKIVATMEANAVVIFMLLIIVPSIVNTEMCTCPSLFYRDSTTCLRAKLTSTPTFIHELQNIFYFSTNVPSFLISTNMTVTITCESAEVDLLCRPSMCPFNWTHLWYEDTAVGAIRELIRVRFRTDPVVLLTGGIDCAPISCSDSITVYLNFSCVSRGEQLVRCEQFEERMRKIWEGILQWVSNSVV